MTYAERFVAPGVVVWWSTGSLGAQRILPDGCLDLIFEDDRLVVAGPDTSARVHTSATARPTTGVRLHGGRGPVLIGVPADVLLDTSVPLEQVWGDRRSRALTAHVARHPVRELGAWATGEGESAGPSPGGSGSAFGPTLLALLERGVSVAAAADALGYSPRQLHRRSLPLFGYGPQHLRRVLRLQRAIAAADRGLAWADAAAEAGYADQGHLAREVRALTGVTPTDLGRERGVRSVQDAA